MDKEKNDYKACILGATVSKREATKVRLAMIFGIIGSLLAFSFFSAGHKIAVYIILFVIISVCYSIANKYQNNKYHITNGCT